jgi:glycosyltransferase involved in cell wall biosynthesis
MPSVSVIIPTYNRGRFIRKAIDSVLNQTFKDYEIIVIDDGSTDGTAKILKSYDNSIIYHSYQPNRGAAYARNRGIEMSRGNYIAFLDSDDFWKPEKLKKQVDFFQQHPDFGVVATQCSVNMIDDNLQTIKYIERETVHFELTYEKIFQRPLIKTPSVMIQKKCFQEIGIFNEKYPILEDVDLWIRLARKYKIGFINEPLTVYTRGHEMGRRESLPTRLIRLEISEKNYDPELISEKLYKKRISSLHAHIGKHYISQGDIKKGKKALLNALSIDRCNARAIKYYISAIWKEKLKQKAN